MWTSLAVTAVFVLLLLVWWAAMTDGGKQTKYNRSGPIGIICITVVFISLLFITYN